MKKGKGNTMGYIKGRETTIQINKLCTYLFQLCVVVDAVIGLDPKLFVISKGCMLAFFIVMIINILWYGNIYLGKALIWPVLFMIINALSCLWAEYPDASLSRLITQAQFYVLFIFTYFIYTNENIEIKKYFDALYIAGICMALYALYRYGWAGLINGLNAGQRLGGEITNENFFGMVFSRAALVAYYYYWRSRRRPIDLMHIVLVVAFTFFSFSSGSKKAFLMIILGILGINILENGFLKMWKTLVISALAIVGIIIILQIPLFSTMNQRIMSFFTGGKDSSDLVRAKMINLSLQLIYEKPILGHGLSNFGAITGLHTYSHNNFTEILVSTGIVSFLFFYIPYLEIIHLGWVEGVRKKDVMVILLFILSIIYLVFGYGMVEYYDRGYWMFFGVMIASIDNLGNNDERMINNDKQ